MEQLCVVIYEPSEEGKKALHDALAAYAVSNDMEVTIRWLRPTAADEQIAAACTQARIAFVSTADMAQAVRVGKILCDSEPDCALIYCGQDVPQDPRETVAYFSALFSARPVRYLDRPTERDHYRAVDDVMCRAAGKALYVCQTKGLRFRLPYESILYFRSDRNYVTVHLRDGAEHSFPGKLTNVERQVPKCLFVRVHQSYLVNRTAVRIIDKGKKSVRLSSGEEIFISRAHYQDALQI